MNIEWEFDFLRWFVIWKEFVGFEIVIFISMCTLNKKLTYTQL